MWRGRSVGPSGGGAQLTQTGVELLAAADALARSAQQVLARLQAPGASPALQQLSIRQHAQASCLRGDRPRKDRRHRAEVQLALADGTALVARITRSVELLGLLMRGVVALYCKAAVLQPAGSADAATWPQPCLEPRDAVSRSEEPDDGSDRVTTARLAAGAGAGRSSRRRAAGCRPRGRCGCWWTSRDPGAGLPAESDGRSLWEAGAFRGCAGTGAPAARAARQAPLQLLGRVQPTAGRSKWL